MQTNLLAGFLLVLVAGLLQGTFILPMTLVRKWSWEHTWATFSLLGMFVFNWIITLLLVPNIFVVYSSSPRRDLALLALFGMGWGVGAILFGLGMDRLGMALGYPVIMGLIASLGSLIPLLVFFSAGTADPQGATPPRRYRTGSFRHRVVLGRWCTQSAFRRFVKCNKVQRLHGGIDHRYPGRDTLVLAQRSSGLR
jgi:hypothetical protein